MYSTSLEHSRTYASESPGLKHDMQAYPFTLGLLIHALADGLALGVSALSNEAGDFSDTTLVVFMALFIHKGTTWHVHGYHC
jgi:zinc transporter 9